LIALSLNIFKHYKTSLLNGLYLRVLLWYLHSFYALLW
jgi:hypothetical protein